MKIKLPGFNHKKLPGTNWKRFQMPEWKLKFRLLFYGITLLCSIASVAETVLSRLGNRVDMVVHTVSACCLLLSGYYLSRDLIVGVQRAVRCVRERYALADRICQDYRYRTVLCTTFSFLVNSFYAVSNGVYGWFWNSPWLGTLAAYYSFLSIMRFGVVRYGWRASEIQADKEVKLGELRIYEKTGILLLLITVVLGGAVVLLVHNEGGKTYPGTLILAAAAYTFYKIIVSAVHMGKARRLQSPLLVAVRNIGYADALVSMLSLQTAMLVSYGNDSGPDPQWMNGMTGAAVCMMISFIGIYMILSAKRQREKLAVRRDRANGAPS